MERHDASYTKDKMSEDFSEAELEAYLDEALDPEKIVEIERLAREDPELLKRLSLINSRRDAGIHSLGDIWRRHQVAVPPRDQLAGFINGSLPPEQMDYISFRLETLKCPFTAAIVNELRMEASESIQLVEQRRQRIIARSRELFDDE